jgi:hypothetical protein
VGYGCATSHLDEWPRNSRRRSSIGRNKVFTKGAAAENHRAIRIGSSDVFANLGEIMRADDRGYNLSGGEGTIGALPDSEKLIEFLFVRGEYQLRFRYTPMRWQSQLQTDLTRKK